MVLIVPIAGRITSHNSVRRLWVSLPGHKWVNDEALIDIANFLSLNCFKRKSNTSQLQLINAPGILQKYSSGADLYACISLK